MSKTRVYIVEIEDNDESGRKKLENICNEVKWTSDKTIKEYEWQQEYDSYMGGG